jgi:AcrR family transcriptional regulator
VICVTSRASAKVRRKSADDRRAEILAAATHIALSDGLHELTLRKVATELGVVNSLVSHYFPSVDDLLAETFGSSAEAELDELFAEVEGADTPLDALRQLLQLVSAEERDQISLLWLDAWHAGRRRPVLGAEVSRQMSNWAARLTGLLEDGRAAGQFTTADSYASSVRIIAVIDGLSIQAVMRDRIGYESVRELVLLVAERELGLPVGSLASPSA